MYGGELILNRFCICVVCMRERVRNCGSVRVFVLENLLCVCVNVSKEMHHDNSE